MKPVIMLTFANDIDNYLPMIKEESKSIFKKLQTHHDNGYVQVHKEENTSISDIFEQCNRYLERIVIFHYGGHADGTQLQLETNTGEPQSAYAKGLAQLLGQQEQLQLVFLNGCATKKQVNLLLDAGVKAIIATSVPIEDQLATEFAEQFYSVLANGATIHKSFATAKAIIDVNDNDSREIRLFPCRRPNLSEEPFEKIDFPWGLYYDETRPEVLEWKLPSSNQEAIVFHSTGGVAGASAKVNTSLVETLLNEMIGWGIEKPKQSDWRVHRTTVIDNFPLPVGEQLRILFLSQSINTQRLKQLVITYQTAIELICFTLLSQLWDAQFENPRSIIQENYLTNLKNFFAIERDNVHIFDYVEFAATLLDIFQVNRIPCFFEELNSKENPLTSDHEFDKAYRFMERMKKDFESGMPVCGVKTDDPESLCMQAEAYLGTILKKLIFLINYRLTSIKKIEVIKPRHRKATFNHYKVALDRVSQGLADESVEYDSFTDNNSVVFLKNNGDTAGYLSLSPFIIDENSLKGNEKNECSKLFYYSHREMEQGNPCYIYTFSDNRQESLRISDTKYPEIKELIEAFKERILDGSIT